MDRSRALLGLTLALLARRAQQPDADPHILATLSSSVDGRYPHEWSDEQRGKAVARDVIEPLSIMLLLSSTGRGEAQARGPMARDQTVQEKQLLRREKRRLQVEE